MEKTRSGGLEFGRVGKHGAKHVRERVDALAVLVLAPEAEEGEGVLLLGVEPLGPWLDSNRSVPVPVQGWAFLTRKVSGPVHGRRSDVECSARP